MHFSKTKKEIFDLQDNTNVNTLKNIYNAEGDQGIDLILDTQIIYFNDNLEILRYLNIEPSNLYSFNNKHEQDDYYKSKSFKEKKTYKIGGSNEHLTTFYSRPIRFEKDKMIFYINFFGNIRVHIPLLIDRTRYYIEFTAQPDKKLIIVVSTDRRHRDEIIHISCFYKSYIHITFVNDHKHYKLYHLINPDISAKYQDIIDILGFAISLFSDHDLIYHDRYRRWDNSVNNDWNNDIIYHRNSRNSTVFINKIKNDLSILKTCIIYLKDINFIFDDDIYLHRYISR